LHIAAAPWPDFGGFVASGTCLTPFSVMFVRSAVPCTSIRTSACVIVPVGTGTWLPAAASVAAVNV
jgi:hypothetical protein